MKLFLTTHPTHRTSRAILSRCLIVSLLSLPLRFPIVCWAQDAAPSQALDSGAASLYDGGTVFVRDYDFIGKTIFSRSELGALIEPQYRNAYLTGEDLEEIRILLTAHYVDAGYINSGVSLEDQKIGQDGVIKFTVVEGKLGNIEFLPPLKDNPRPLLHLTRKYLEARIRRSGGKPFNSPHLQRELESWRLGQNVSQLEASLLPGEKPGDARLQLRVMENNPYSASLEFDNYRPSTVGEERVRLVAANTNLTGQEDAFNARIQMNSGGLNFSQVNEFGNYDWSYLSPPLSTRGALADTRLSLDYSRNDSAVVDAQFRDLGISSNSRNAGLGLHHQLHRSLQSEDGLSLSLENRRSRSYLGGERFSFSPGDINGEAQTTAVRLGYDFVRRSEKRVLAGQTILSYGDDFRGSTRNAKAPNGEFLSLLSQVQYVQFLGETQNQVVLRLSGQLSNNPLLSVEQFSIGGANSVRGYLENQLVRDEGFTASIECRLPVKTDPRGRAIVTAVPFVDTGYARDHGIADSLIKSGTERLTSVGLGVIYAPDSRLNAQVFYGYRLHHVQSENNGLQGKGIHFALTWRI